MKGFAWASALSELVELDIKTVDEPAARAVGCKLLVVVATQIELKLGAGDCDLTHHTAENGTGGRFRTSIHAGSRGADFDPFHTGQDGLLEHLPDGCSRDLVVPIAEELDVQPVQLIQHFQEVAYRTRQAVTSPDQDDIEPAARKSVAGAVSNPSIPISTRSVNDCLHFAGKLAGEMVQYLANERDTPNRRVAPRQ
jgi:hypothetical protein